MNPVIIGKATLYNADCLDILPTLKGDLCFTSPPYNMRTRIRNGKYTERERGDHFSKKYDDFHDAMPIDDYYEMHKKVIELTLTACNLAMFNFQIVTGSKEAWFKLIGHFNKEIKDIVIWDKGFAQPAMHDSVINRGHEQILIMEKNASAGRAISCNNFSRGELADIWRISNKKDSIDGHGATFPMLLPQTAICNFTKPEQIVIDPFMGSGTTGVAALNLNRKFIGVELSNKYFDIACMRIEQSLQQVRLFA